MAKKKVEGTGKAIDIFKTLHKMDNTVEILEKSAYSNISHWISSGNYILNACLSGDLHYAIPCGRVTTIAGPSGTGKSYLACSICREGQYEGYTPVYLDSEGAIDKDFVARLGCDPNNFIIKQVNTIKETTTFIANMCKDIQEQVDAGAELPKIILVLDSLGNLTSDKEKNDAITGNTAADFTKAKDTKALFRVVTQPLSKLQIPFIVTNHVYANIGSFTGGTIMANGSGIVYAGSVTLNLASIAKLVDKDNDKAAAATTGSETAKKNGILVSAWPDKSRFCLPRKVKFQIPFYKKPNKYLGLEEYLNWDNAGILQGKCYTQAEYDKLDPADQLEADKHKWEFNGEMRYAIEKKTMVRGVGIVCKHLGRQVDIHTFYSKEVFTPEFLDYINTNIIGPLFKLPDQSSFDDIDDIVEDLNLKEEEKKAGIINEDESTGIETDA